MTAARAALGVAKCHAAAVRDGGAVDIGCLAYASARLATGFAHADTRPPCPTTGVAVTTRSILTTVGSDLAALAGAGPSQCDARKLFAAGKQLEAAPKAEAAHAILPERANATARADSMRKRTQTSVLEAWYSRISLDDVLALVGKDAALVAQVEKRAAEAREQTHEHVLHKLTTPVRGLPRIVDQPPLLFHRKDVTERVLFDRFTLIDAALKVVGVGSVGTRCYAVLFLAAPDDPLFLQVKEARRSVLEQFTHRARVKHNGQRVVVGQRLMQSASDIFLGWSRGPTGRDFYVRQLRDMKVAPAVESQTPQVMRAYATLCGLALARAHDKAGDAAMIAGYLGKSDQFDEAIGDYAVEYADQVERDCAVFVAAVRSGRLKSDLSPRQLETALR